MPNIKPIIFKYSIIIPHYNYLTGLKKLIESIPIRNDIQIILVDDNTYLEKQTVASFVKSLNRENLELYFSDKTQKGAGNCRNIGLRHVKGSWILFADADDYFTENAFEILDSCSNTDVELIYFSPTSIELPAGEIGTRHLSYEKLVNDYEKKPSNTTELRIRYNFAVPWSKAISQKLTYDKKIEFDTTRWSNDVMFSTKCGYYAKNIAAIDKTIYCVTRKKGTLTTTRNWQEFETRLKVYISRYKFLEERLTPKQFRIVVAWPGGKLIRALVNGYGLRGIRKILQLYRDNNISLKNFGLYNAVDVWTQFIQYFRNRKYYDKGKDK